MTPLGDENFVTIFDSAYLPQGIAMCESLTSVEPSSVIWVVCADAETYEILTRLGLEKVNPVSLDSLLSEELRELARTRSWVEFLWTLTPFLFGFIFGLAKEASRVTYVDADLFFFRSPSKVMADFQSSRAAILLTEHGFGPNKIPSLQFGRFNVQFVSITREGYKKIGKWWSEKCFEWCFARVKDGKYGDQGYLSEIPKLFPTEFFVAEPKSDFQGPWNADQFAPETALTYHFHGFRLLRFRRALLHRGTWAVPKAHHDSLYRAYLKAIAGSLNLIKDVRRKNGLVGPKQALDIKAIARFPYSSRDVPLIRRWYRNWRAFRGRQILARGPKRLIR